MAREGRPRHRLISKSAHVHFNCTKRSPAEGPGSLCGSAGPGDAVVAPTVWPQPKAKDEVPIDPQPGWKPRLIQRTVQTRCIAPIRAAKPSHGQTYFMRLSRLGSPAIPRVAAIAQAMTTGNGCF